MTVEELSNRILDENFGESSPEIEHYDGERVLLSNQRSFNQNGSNEITHYGILGMKWGVRRTPEELGHKVPKKSRKYAGESDSEYQARMQRESQERQQKARIKAEANAQKRNLKAVEKQHKMVLKSQEKLAKAEKKYQDKERERQYELQKEKQKQQENTNKRSKTKSIFGNKVATKTMTDQELNDAINRLRKEKEYKELRSPFKKTVKSTAGSLVSKVGMAVVSTQLTKLANKKIEEYMTNKSGSKTKTEASKIASETAKKATETVKQASETAKKTAETGKVAVKMVANSTSANSNGWYYDPATGTFKYK